MSSRAGARPSPAAGKTSQGEVGDFGWADIPATAAGLPSIRHALATWVRRVGLNDDLVDQVVLAAYEAMANVVTHAYPRGRGTFDVHAAYRPDQGQLRVIVSDRGRWQRPSTRKGFGLRLIKGLAAHTSVAPGPEGTTVQMSWPLLCTNRAPVFTG